MELVGILNVWKSREWTSHDVVARVRRLAGQRRVGHAGTLDPLAEGVLPVLMGRATRLADFVGLGHKRYSAVVQLGARTTTDDQEGEIVETAPVPDFSQDEIDEVLTRFLGEVPQIPPAYSAIKVDGRRAYALARGGAHPEMRARTVTILALEARRDPGNLLALEVHCSRGTYVRSLARDIAAALGTVGYLRSLARTQVGPFLARDALTLDQIAERGIANALIPPDVALADCPEVRLDRASLTALAQGKTVPFPGVSAEAIRVYDSATERMEFVGAANEGLLRARLTLYPDAPARVEAL